MNSHIVVVHRSARPSQATLPALAATRGGSQDSRGVVPGVQADGMVARPVGREVVRVGGTVYPALATAGAFEWRWMLAEGAPAVGAVVGGECYDLVLADEAYRVMEWGQKGMEVVDGDLVRVVRVKFLRLRRPFFG